MPVCRRWVERALSSNAPSVCTERSPLRRCNWAVRRGGVAASAGRDRSHEPSNTTSPPRPDSLSGPWRAPSGVASASTHERGRLVSWPRVSSAPACQVRCSQASVMGVVTVGVAAAAATVAAETATTGAAAGAVRRRNTGCSRNWPGSACACSAPLRAPCHCKPREAALSSVHSTVRSVRALSVACSFRPLSSRRPVSMSGWRAVPSCSTPCVSSAARHGPCFGLAREAQGQALWRAAGLQLERTEVDHLRGARAGWVAGSDLARDAQARRVQAHLQTGAVRRCLHRHRRRAPG
jgi:hypothetical protein